MSDYINQVLRQDLLEENEDLKDIEKIINEPTIAFDEMLKELGRY